MIAYRLSRMLSVARTDLFSITALLVTVAFMVVAAAPSWAILITLALLAVPQTRLAQALSPSLPWLVILSALLPLACMPLLGAPSWIALDVALIACSILGMAQAQGGAIIGRALLPFAWLIVWLGFESARHLTAGLSHAS